MGRCTIQLVGVPEEESPKEVDPVGQLWWVTPATKVAVRELMTPNSNVQTVGSVEQKNE